VTLSKIFEPIRIRNVEIPNRVARTAHGTALSSPRELLGGEDFIAYHVARARGGVGLSILEAMAVHPSSGALTASDDRVVDRYRALMREIRPHGMRVFQQLFHQGHIGPASDGSVSWSVSTVPSVYGNVSEPMRSEQIEEVAAAFGAAAARCRDGGLDGVELHASHGYLPAQFLSELYNYRTDEYGGSLENRMRITQEILRAMRAAVGDDFVVGVRLAASEMPGSVSEQELRLVINALEREGLIDYLTTSRGDHYKPVTIRAGMELAAGYELPSSGQLTAAATVPSIVTGRFRTLEEAEQVLVDGTADMVSMVRALIADPDIVRKTRAGRASEVRPCIACNQGCAGGVARFPQRMVCAVNAAAGFERTLSEDLLTPVQQPRRVLVVGGGPAGLEAARIAALSGHDVKLVEASSTLGGALDAARRSPRFALIGDIADWLGAAVERAGVEVVLDTYMSAGDVLADGADAVIVATGSRPRLDGFQPARPFEPARGTHQSHVRSSVELLMQGVPDGARTALVLDTVGHFEAITVAEYLIDKGLAVTYVTSLPSFSGVYVQTTSRDVPALEFLYSGEFTLLVRHHLVEIRSASCLVRPSQGQRDQEVPADVVVLVTQNAPNRQLYDDLLDAGRRDVFVIGDAASPRDLQVAIAEAHRVARALPSRMVAAA
jgi:2,4-dienoyl-CoA reductase-like NADH-dependent reductase (Old Yellow Enzyme family)/thioredoxin reductase